MSQGLLHVTVNEIVTPRTEARAIEHDNDTYAANRNTSRTLFLPTATRFTSTPNRDRWEISIYELR
jgi:hypothetical protein